MRFIVGVAVFACFVGSARAELVTNCNYSFRAGPYEDRGSVQVMKGASGLSMQFVEDDVVTRLDKVVASSANGDQARDLIGRNKDFKIYVTQARIFEEEIDHVDAYVASIAGDPQARFFAFYGKKQQYLGGFGTHGKVPFVCDWVGD